MTPLDAYEDDMGGLPRLSQREIDRLLAGEPSVDGDVEDLTGLVRDVREAYLAPPSDAIEARQLATMAEAARVTDSQASPVRSPRDKAHRRPRALVWREATMTRIRNAALAVKLAAITLVAALATGGLAGAGVISLPNPLPEDASDRAKEVHRSIDVQDPAAERKAAEAASQAKERGKANSPGRNGDVGVQQNGGGEPDPQRLREFGDSVPDRSGAEPQETGRELGESVSEEAQQLVPRPSPQTAPQGGRETGESFSQQGQESGESFSDGGRQAGENASGGRVPPR